MSAFFECVAEDVNWTVGGTHPIAGRYTNKRGADAQTFSRAADPGDE